MPTSQFQLHLPGMEYEPLPRTNEEFDRDNESLECPACGNEFIRADGVTCDGELHCCDCVHSCEHCDHTSTDSGDFHLCYTRGDIHVTSRRQPQQLLCESCSWQCADCNDWFVESADDARNSSGERICSCCGEHYRECDRCDALVHEADSYYFEPNEQDLCESCYREATEEDNDTRDEGSGTIIHWHGHKPAARFYHANGSVTSQPVTPDTLYIGAEVEVDAPCKLDRVAAIIRAGLHENPFYHCENDGSLDQGGDDSGFEVVSKAGTWEYWQSADLSWMDSLKESGFRSYDTSTCGQHFHASRAFFNAESLFSLLVFFKHNGEFLHKLSRRDGESGYAKFYPFKGVGTKHLVLKMQSRDGDRYEALNLTNANTIEFRMFRGTLSKRSFRRNMALVVALCHFAKFITKGRRTWNTPEFFVKWIRAKGRDVLGKPAAFALALWCDKAINGTLRDDIAA